MNTLTRRFSRKQIYLIGAVLAALVFVVLLLFLVNNVQKVGNVFGNAEQVKLKIVPKDEAEIKEYSAEFKQDETAFAFLERLESEQSEQFSFDFQEFSFGKYVDEFNGIKATEEQFWAITVNGEPSSAGTEQYIVRSGDQLEFVLTDIENIELL